MLFHSSVYLPVLFPTQKALLFAPTLDLFLPDMQASRHLLWVGFSSSLSKDSLSPVLFGVLCLSISCVSFIFLY
jgi:hypothetical protein